MKAFFCRIFQFFMKIGYYFIPLRTPELLEGDGCVKQLAKPLMRAGAKHPMVVTDAGLTGLGLPDSMITALREAGLTVTVFDGAQPNPTDKEVEEGLQLYRQNGCDSLIAFGGGSPMDCAKAIGARAVRPGKNVARLQGLFRVLRRLPPFIAVPTTAGTGSETTLAAVITDSASHRKASINDPSLVPHMAVLDPELTLGLPPSVTAATGMDALCHAVEAYTNHTYCTALENRLAKDAVRLIHQYLLRAYHDGSDREARQQMQKAAFYAGRAFTRGCVGNVHAAGHTLSALYGVAHGQAMAVLLPFVLRMYGRRVHQRLAELAQVCGFAGDTPADQARAFIGWIEQMNGEMGLPSGFAMIRDEDLPRMAAWAQQEANPIYPVPQVWGDAEFTALFRSVRKAAQQNNQ